MLGRLVEDRTSGEHHRDFLTHTVIKDRPDWSFDAITRDHNQQHQSVAQSVCSFMATFS